MKKSIYPIFMSLLAIAACSKEETSPEETGGSAEGFCIKAEIPGTKTVFTPPTSVKWERGDEISVITEGENWKFTNTSAEDNIFTGNGFYPESGKEYEYTVFYPYDALLSVTESGLSSAPVSLPYGNGNSQNGISDASHVKGFLAGTASAAGTESPAVKLSHLTSVITVTVKNCGTKPADIRKIVISTDAEDAVLSGDFTVDFINLKLEAGSNAGKEAVLNVNDAVIQPWDQGDFYITVPEFTVPQGKNITVKVTAGDDSEYSFTKTAADGALEFTQGGSYSTTVTVGDGNYVYDSGFDEAELAHTPYDEPLVYNEWLYYVAGTHTGKFTLEIADDAEGGKVGKMTNAGTPIPNSDPGRSFFCQMIEGTMDPGLYTIAFKAKAASGPAKTRIFIRTTDADGKPAATYFPFYSGKPAADDSKYTAYCKNCPEATPTDSNPPLSTEKWMEFEFIIDLSKVVPTGSVAYSSAAASTETDRTGILVCLQNNAADSAMLIDNVTLAKYTEESSSETEN